MNAEINNFLDVMYRTYTDNAKVQHLARERTGRSWSTMPTTSFVYNFFIYNSIYQFDWKTSLDKGELCHWHGQDETDVKLDTSSAKEPHNEGTQQEALEKFMRNICRESPELLAVAFRPISQLDDLNGSWTQISAGQRISEADGRDFFRRLSDLGCLVQSAIETQDGIVPASKSNFKLIKECRYYVYHIRNNIFHGSKSLGEIGDKNQKRRLAHYDLFLRCILNLFFLCHKKSPLPEVYSMLVTDDPPPPNRSRRKLETQIHISQSARRYSKPGDRQLISWIAEHDSGIVSQPRANSALFYPSAGEDIVTPTIIGLPHCRNFYYYELLIRALPASFIKGLEESLGTEIETQKTEYEDLYLFDIDGIRRTIHWVHRDIRSSFRRINC